MKPGKLRDNLIEHAEMARLSRELVDAALRRARCPSRSTIWSCKGIPDAPLRAFLEHHGFKSLIAKLSAVADAPVPRREPGCPAWRRTRTRPATTTATRRWSTRTRSTAGSRSRRHQGWVAIDTETTGVDATRAELVGVSMALHPNLACYIPLAHGGTRHVRREAGAARPRRWRWRS